jgi:hypothetical protein
LPHSGIRHFLRDLDHTLMLGEAAPDDSGAAFFFARKKSFET